MTVPHVLYSYHSHLHNNSCHVGGAFVPTPAIFKPVLFWWMFFIDQKGMVAVCVCAYRGRAIGERLKENETYQMTCFSVSLILKHKIMLIIWEPCLCSYFFFLGRNICNTPFKWNKKGLLCQVNMCIKLLNDVTFSTFFFLYFWFHTFYFHLTMTFWKGRKVVLCFIIFYRRFLLSNFLPNLYLFYIFLSQISERRDRTRTSQYDFSEQDYYIGNHNARRTFSCNGNSFTSHTRLVGILIQEE